MWLLGGGMCSLSLTAIAFLTSAEKSYAFPYHYHALATVIPKHRIHRLHGRSQSISDAGQRHTFDLHHTNRHEARHALYLLHFLIRLVISFHFPNHRMENICILKKPVHTTINQTRNGRHLASKGCTDEQ